MVRGCLITIFIAATWALGDDVVHICQPEELKVYESASLSTTVYTSRNIHELKSVMPPFFDLEALKAGSFDILEIGCGNGRALMELQSMSPLSRTFCLNKAGYGFEQIESGKLLVNIARFYNISIYCSSANGRAVLPHVVSGKGVQEDELPFTKEYYDLVVSHHALNEGKLQSSDSKYVPPRVARLLRPDGVASLMLLFHRAHYLFPGMNTSRFAFTRVTNVKTSQGKKFSIGVYVVGWNLGLYMRRCQDSEKFVIKWGCIFVQPYPKGFDGVDYEGRGLKEMEQFESIIENFPRPRLDPIGIGSGSAHRHRETDQHFEYSIDYASTLYHYLDKVRRNPDILLEED